MIVWPAEYNRRKDTAFASIAAAAGGGRRLRMIGLSFRSFPESRARAEAALARAKKQPVGRMARAAKYRLIWAQYNWSRRFFTRHPDAVAMCWNGLTGSRKAFMDGASDAGAARLFVELAPLPYRLTLDPEGMNAENALPRDRAFYDAWALEHPAEDMTAWRRLGQGMTARPSRRADVGQGQAAGLGDTPFLFVPLQVPDDSQIRLFSGWTGGLEGFIAALGKAAGELPDGWQVRLKEHPSSRISLAAPIARAREASGGRLVLDNQTDTFAQVAASRGVVTINSSVGLQAFFHDRPVIVAGEAFFAMPGLVTPAGSAEALAAVFAAAPSLAFDATLRDRFMSYLVDQYYLPITESGGRVMVDAETVRRIVAQAQAHAWAPVG